MGHGCRSGGVLGIMETLIYMAAIVSALIILAWTLDYDDEQDEKIER